MQKPLKLCTAEYNEIELQKIAIRTCFEQGTMYLIECADLNEALSWIFTSGTVDSTKQSLMWTITKHFK